MVGVGWLVLIDDWLGRGGPGGAMLAYLLGGLLLLPVAYTYTHLVRAMPDAGAEIAYTEAVFPRFWSFAAGWLMVLAYAIVCPWEAVAIGNLLARQFPAMNTWPLYQVGESTIYAPRLVCGPRAHRDPHGPQLPRHEAQRHVPERDDVRADRRVRDLRGAGFRPRRCSNLEPLFAQTGGAGAWVSILLVLQIVPYYMTGFESIVKGAEEARPGYDTRGFSRAILLALFAGALFYVTVVAVVAFIVPWREIVDGSLGTEAAFERAFGSRAIAQLDPVRRVPVAAQGVQRQLRGVDAVDPRGRPARPGASVACDGAPALRHAVGRGAGDGRAHRRGIVPRRRAAGAGERGGIARGRRRVDGGVRRLPGLDPNRRAPEAARNIIVRPFDRALAGVGVFVGAGIVLMKVVPAVPGSFGPAEWIAFGGWVILGLAFWAARGRGAPTST